MIYLSRRWNPNNRRGWKKIRSKYLPALHYLVGSYPVWTTSEELDAIDRARSLTLDEVLAEKQAARGNHGKGEGEGEGSLKNLLFLKVQREIYPGVKGKK